MLQVSIRETFHFYWDSERRNATDIRDKQRTSGGRCAPGYERRTTRAIYSTAVARSNEISDQATGSIRRITTPNASEPTSAINAAMTNAQ